MRRIVKISLGGLALLALILAAAWIGVFHTSAGKIFIEAELEKQLQALSQKQFASTMTLGEIDGNLPGDVILRDVTLSTEQGIWFRLGEVHLSWSPLGLASRKILVRELSIEDAEILAMPPTRPSPPKAKDQAARNITLPWIELDQVNLDSLLIAEGILGEQREFLAEGAFSTASGKITSDLRLYTRDARDRLEARISSNRRQLTVDLALNSAETGLIAGLMNSDAPVAASINGAAPLDDWRGDIQLQGGPYGTVSAAFSGDLKKQKRFALSGSARPGAKWPAAAKEAIGDELVFDLAGEKPRTRWSLSIGKIQGAFGHLAGIVPGVKSARDIRAENLDLTLTLAPEYAATKNISFIDGAQRLTGDIIRDDTGWHANATLNNMLGTVTMTELHYSDAGKLAGSLSLLANPLKLPSPQLTALLANGFEASTDLVLEDKLLTLTRLNATTGNQAAGDAPSARAELFTDAAFHLENRSLLVNGRASLPPSLLNSFTDAVAFENAAALTFSTEGPLNNISPNITARFSQGTLRGHPFAAGTLDTKLTNLQTTPQLALTLDASDASYSAKARVRQAHNSPLKADITALRIGHMTMAGTITYDPKRKALVTNVTTSANPSRAHPDAMMSDGTVTLTGNALLGATPALSFDLSANNLITRQGAAETLTLSAKGPLSALALDLEGANLRVAGQSAASLSSKAQLTLADNDLALTLFEASAKAKATDKKSLFQLVAPTRLSRSAQGIDLDRTQITFRDDAGLTIEGTISPRQWLLEATGRNLRLPYLKAPLNLSASIDTDAPTPGRVTLNGQATNQNDETYLLESTTLWDGRSLGTIAALARQNGAPSGKLTLTTPLILTKQDTLSISTADQSLNGQFQFSDAIEAILAFIETGGADFEGLLNANVMISGSLKKPALAGDMTLAQGRFEEQQTGAVMTDIAGKFGFSIGTDGADGRFQLSGKDSAGAPNAIRLEGEIALGQQADEALSRIKGKLTLDKATLVKSPDLTLQANSNLALSGSLSKMLLAGTIDILKLDAVIPDIERKKTYVPVEIVRIDQNQGFSDQLEQQEETTPVEIQLDLAIKAANEILINGRGLTSEWKADLRATGTAAKPDLKGSIESIRGSFDFAGRQFALSQGIIRFPGGASLIPLLNIQADYAASRAGSEITTQIGVQGPATDPQISLSSVPPLPQEDVLALVLFGKQPTELSALESLRIASAVASLSGNNPLGSGAGLGDGLRRTLGLDALNFAQDAATGLSNLTIGKYISDDIYISTKQTVGGLGTSVSITYDVTDNVSLESTIEQDGAQSVSANYKRDY